MRAQPRKCFVVFFEVVEQVSLTPVFSALARGRNVALMGLRAVPLN